MGYSELVKNFEKSREYLREFYVFGFKSTEEFDDKPRMYQYCRERVESWLQGYMDYQTTKDGKYYYLSIDSKAISHNPLFQAFKAKSFTGATLHFVLLDIFRKSEEPLSLSMAGIMKGMESYWESGTESFDFSENTIRNKLNDYVEKGIFFREKNGKACTYGLVKDVPIYSNNVFDFFSEVLPCGVVGSYLLDREENQQESCFTFKHHYITSVIDSEILYQLLQAMHEKKWIDITWIDIKSIHNKKEGKQPKVEKEHVVPIKILDSVQNGRQYLIAYHSDKNCMFAYRIDYITSIKLCNECKEFDDLRKQFQEMSQHMWGVCTSKNCEHSLERIEFTVSYSEDEPFIHQRLEKERRCGTVKQLDKNTSSFYAEVYDARELLPWIRTFIGRIKEFDCSNEEIKIQFKQGLKEMYQLYEVG